MVEFLNVILTVVLICVCFFVSIKIQNFFFKDTNQYKSITLTLTIYLFTMSIFYILFFYDLLSIRSKYFQLNPDSLMNILIFMNLIFYIVTPMIYFYIKNENEKQLNLSIISDNESFFKAYSQFFKNYMSYLFLFAILNGMYFYYFTVLSVDRYRDLLKSTIVPRVLLKYSKLESGLEILTYFNCGMTVTFGKLIMFTYIPFGMAKTISYLIDSLRNNDHIIKFFFPSYSNSTGFFKLYFTIANFFLLTLSVVSTITLIYTKVVLFYNKLKTNICGIDCGLLSFRYDETISFEYILYEIIKNSNSNNDIMLILHLSIFAIIMLFRFCSVIMSLYTKGIAIFTFNLINYQVVIKDCMLTFVFLFLAFWANIILFYDMTYVAPDYVRFYDLSNKCDFLQIDSPECGLSFYGLFYIKLSMNFIFFIYVDLFATCVFIVTSIIWFYILVGNSIKNFFSYQAFPEDIITERREIRGKNRYNED